MEALQTHPSVYVRIMSIKEIETNNVSGSQSLSKHPHLAGAHDWGTLVVIMRILSLVSEGSGLAKRIRSL